MRFGEYSEQRKKSISYKLLCVIIAAALALLLIPAASLRAIAENAKKTEGTEQATEQSSEKATDANSESAKSGDTTKEQTSTEESNPSALNAQNNVATNNENTSVNSNGSVTNAVFKVTVKPETASGVKLYKVEGGAEPVECAGETVYASSYQATYSETYSMNTLTLTLADGLTVVYGSQTIQGYKGSFYNTGTNEFLEQGEPVTLTAQASFVATQKSKVTVKTILPEGGGTVEPTTDSVIPFGAKFNHATGSDTMTFTYGTKTLATYKATPELAYAIDKFAASTDESGSKTLSNGAVIKDWNIYVHATFIDAPIVIPISSNKAEWGTVTSTSASVTSSWKCKIDFNNLTFYDPETPDKIIITANANDGYKFSHFSYTDSQGQEQTLKDGEYTDMKALATGIVANFSDGHYAQTIFKKSQVKGDTTANLLAAGWRNTDAQDDSIEYFKLFDKSAKLSTAVADFNAVEKTIQSDTSDYKRVGCREEAEFTKDLDLEQLWTFKLKATPPEAAQGALVWTDGNVENMDFFSMDCHTSGTKVEFSNVRYYDKADDQVKNYDNFSLNATANEGYSFKCFNGVPEDPSLFQHTTISASFNVTHKITLNYGLGSPKGGTTTLTDKGWVYDGTIHTATKWFEENTDIAKIFEEGSSSWSADCEATLEGHTSKWAPPRKGVLDADKVYIASYDPVSLKFKAQANPTVAATITVTPEGAEDVLYGDTVTEDATTHALTINHKEGTKVTPVAQISFTPNASYNFDKWTAVNDEGQEISYSEGIKENITFVANFEQDLKEVTFDATSLNGGKLTYTEAGKEPQTTGDTLKVNIPKNYAWTTAKSLTGTVYQDTIIFWSSEGVEYARCVVNPTTENPLALFMNENSHVLGEEDKGTVKNAFSLYPVVFKAEDKINVTGAVSDESQGSVECYAGDPTGTKLSSNTFEAAKPIKYTKRTTAEGKNYLEIKTSIDTNYSIVALPNAGATFLGWASKVGEKYEWLTEDTGTFSSDVTLYACIDSFCTVKFSVADGQSELGKLDKGGEYTVRLNKTTYTKNTDNSITLSDETYGEIVTVTPSAVDPNFFDKWTPEASSGTITDNTNFIANFTKGYVAKMDAGDGKFTTSPTGWTAKTEGSKTVYVKNFVTGTTYNSIYNEWLNNLPSKTGHYFDAWSPSSPSGTELKANTTFTATYQPNKYKVTFYVNGGKTLKEPGGKWVPDVATDSYSNAEDFVYGNTIESIKSTFKTAVSGLNRDKFIFSGEFATDAESETLEADTQFLALYNYKIDINHDANGTIETEGQTTINDISEYNPFTASFQQETVLVLNDKAGQYENVTYKPVPNKGYHFVNWTDDAGNVIKEGDTFFCNSTLTANFAVNEYEVKFTTNNAEYGNVTTDPVGPQKIKHFSWLKLDSGTKANEGAVYEDQALLTKIYSGLATPSESTQQYTYYFDFWKLIYQDGTTKEVNPDEGLTEQIAGAVEIQANFSKQYTVYNVTTKVNASHTETSKTTISPNSLSNVPYSSKVKCEDHVVHIVSPNGGIKRDLVCTPGDYSVQTAWEINGTKMVEGQEYTIEGTTELAADVVEGSIVKGKVSEAVTGYTLKDSILLFTYNTEANDLSSEYVGPIITDSEGNFEFKDPRLITGKSGTLYTYCAGFYLDSKLMTITEGTMEVNVDLAQNAGVANTVGEGTGHDYFDVTYDGTLTKESGAIHEQVTEIHRAIPAAEDPETPGKDKGTQITFNKDSIFTTYQTEITEEINDAEIYYENCKVVPVAKAGYVFDHFTLNGEEVTPGKTLEVQKDEEYNVTAVYKVLPIDAVGTSTGTGTGSTGDNNWIIFLIVGLVLVAAGVGIGYGLYRKNKGNNAKKNKYTPKH